MVQSSLACGTGSMPRARCGIRKKPGTRLGTKFPETWDEMLALSDQIVSDGDKPWCVGIESGAATGWPATDWMEEIMLRTTSLENYDKWVTGELKFESPEVKNALEVLANLWSDEYVYGGQAAIVSTNFGDAPLPMFEDPPKCWLHKQGNFITSFFPEGVEAGGRDYDFLLSAAHRRRIWQAVPGSWRHHGDVQRPAGSASRDAVLYHRRSAEGLDGGQRRLGATKGRSSWTGTGTT